MPIVAGDLKFFSSERMTDSFDTVVFNSGGGFAAGPIVQDGIMNNVFPLVMPADRITGKRQTRLIYPAVLSNENSMLANGQLAVYARPTDPAVELAAFPASAIGGAAPYQNSAYGAALALDQFFVGLMDALLTSGPNYSAIRFTVAAAGTSDLNNFLSSPALVLGTDIKIGDKIFLAAISTTSGIPVLGAKIYWRTVTAVGSATLSFSGTHPFPLGELVAVARYGLPQFKLSAAGLSTVAMVAGAIDIGVDRVEVRLRPVGATAGTPGIVNSSASGNTSIINAGGLAPSYSVGASVLIQHPTIPATREVRVIQSINYFTKVLVFTAPLTNAYPIGSIVSTLISFGDLQARVSLTPFFQQAWTRVWADTLSGVAITPRYFGAIAMNNAGGWTDRYAIVFTSATAFNLITERFGQIAGGTTAANFLPLNPTTGQPLMTLFATGWSTGWLPGNTMRFNTLGAHAGVHVARVLSPSTAAGTDAGTLIIRGDI